MSTSRYCPTCGRANFPGAEPDVRMTGEFVVPETVVEGPGGTGTSLAPTPMPYAGSDRCSWCGKHASEVKKLITGPGVQICDECVAFCALILRDELGGK
jgi:hypothetical protein